MTPRKRVLLERDDETDHVLPDIIKAAYARDSAAVSALLAEGVDVNSVDPRDNLTALHIGCMNGDTALVDVLLRYEAATGRLDFAIQSKYRPRVAWQFAMNSHHYDIARAVDAAGLAKARRAGPTPEL